MSINRHNYEQYLIDYLDKKLNAVEVSELLLFVEQNPDIKKELEGLEDVLLTSKEFVFEESHLLKRPSYYEVKSQYEDLLVAKLEHDISADDKKELEEGFILYPELKKDETLFSKTILNSDKDIFYENKEALFKRPHLTIIKNKWIRIAAILLMFAFISIIVSQLDNKINTDTQYVYQSATPETREPEVTNTNSVSTTKKHIKINEKKNIEPKPKPKRNTDNSVRIHHLHTQIIAPKSLVEIAKLNPPVTLQQIQIATSASILSYKGTFDDTEKDIIHPKYLTILDVFNKLTGADVAINKDTTGQINHVVIAGLGIEWEKSK